MQYSFSERVVRVVFQTCKRFYFSDATDGIFCLHWNFSAFVCWKSKHTVHGFVQRTKIKESWISSGRLFPVPHGVERTIQGAKERKSTAEIFSAKLPAMAAPIASRRRRSERTYCGTSGDPTKSSILHWGRRTLYVHFLGPRCQILYLKEIELHQKKIFFYFWTSSNHFPFHRFNKFTAFWTICLAQLCAEQLSLLFALLATPLGALLGKGLAVF